MHKLLPVALASLATVLVTRATDPGTEPAEIFTLAVDGVATEITVGTPVRVEIGGEKRELLLESTGARRFDSMGVRFEYPASLGFDYTDYTPTAHVWSLDSLDSSLLVEIFPGKDAAEALEFSTADLVAGMSGEDSTCETTDCSHGFGGEQIAGKQVLVTMGELGEYNHQLYAFDSPAGGLVIIIDDNRDEDGEDSPSFLELRDQIARTLRIDGKSGK